MEVFQNFVAQELQRTLPTSAQNFVAQELQRTLPTGTPAHATPLVQPLAPAPTDKDTRLALTTLIGFIRKVSRICFPKEWTALGR